MIRFLTKRYFWLDIRCSSYPAMQLQFAARTQPSFLLRAIHTLYNDFFTPWHWLGRTYNIQWFLCCKWFIKKGNFRNLTSILDWGFCKNSKWLKVSKLLAIFARISILDDPGSTESKSNKDRLQQRYTVCILYYSGDFIHQISVWT